VIEGPRRWLSLCRAALDPGGYCARVDTLFNMPGVHVLDVALA
jgi:hypothetical protein